MKSWLTGCIRHIVHNENIWLRRFTSRCARQVETGGPAGGQSLAVNEIRWVDVLGWLMGIEPTTTGITIRDSTAELQPPSEKIAIHNSETRRRATTRDSLWRARQESNL